LAREDVRRWGELVGHIPRYRLPHLRSLAVLAEFDGDPKSAIDYLEEALTLTETMGLPTEQWPILVKLGALYQAISEEAHTQSALGLAGEIIQALAKQLQDETLRAGFLSSDTVQAILIEKTIKSRTIT
jgi:hypothetical protein